MSMRTSGSVYWLSELSFALVPNRFSMHTPQVLFDVLKSHGGSFADSFWNRIFERVLLPIFDHVRAEVTDTTTFTSERRRAQEDAWLYETCTHCLQVGIIRRSVLFLCLADMYCMIYI